MMELAYNSITATTYRIVSVRWVSLCFRLMALILGGLHTWAAITSYSINPDGIVYLDMGEAYLRGDWEMAINAYWSPFYSWLLGLGLNLLHPPMQWEFAVVQLVNFLLYLIALGCFTFFWRQLMQYQRNKAKLGFYGGPVMLPEWAWLTLGYSLFIWTSLSLIEVWSVTPDMCVAALVYLAAGLMIRIRGGCTTRRTFALLGLILGLAYLSKAIMFPLTFVFLGVNLFSGGNFRRGGQLTLLAFVVFVLVAGPFIMALSAAKGRLTFGDSGKLNYARYVNGLPDAHWQGERPGNG